MTLGMDLAPEDFRQMWQHPSYEELRSTLHSLELSPPVWKHDRQRSDILREQEYMQGHRKGEVTRYLSSIIKSPLLWLEDDEQREEIWSQASKRLSERCGRTAMGDVTRRWPFEGGENSPEAWEVVIREPALTGDSLGLKTWGSSYVLARHLPQLAATSLAGVFRSSSPADKSLAILELGSGTGLLGVAAAALWGTSVALSDLPNIVPNLKHNAELNRGVVEDRGGSLSVGALTWGGGDDEVDQELFAQHFQFNIVLVADPLYDDNHPALLASTIAQHLAMTPEARAVVMVPQRDHTTKRLLGAFKQEMLGTGEPLTCEEEDELAGQDDWVEDGDGGRVQCWLGVFSRGKVDGGGIVNHRAKH